MSDIISSVALLIILIFLVTVVCPRVLNHEISSPAYQELALKVKDSPRAKELMKFSLEDGKITISEMDDILLSLREEEKLKVIEEIRK